MFERMLDKTKEPTFEEMISFCGEIGKVWLETESFLQARYDLQKEIRFPYGKDYGWGVSYKHGKKHICDIYAEKDAFTVFFQIRSEAVETIKSGLSEYALKAWDSRYPCGSGGWVRYRITDKEQLADVQNLLAAKVKPKK